MDTIVPRRLTRGVTTPTDRILDHVRSWWADVRELDQRLALLARPWDEELLHWSAGPRGRELHGAFVPPAARAACTGRGWCVGALH